MTLTVSLCPNSSYVKMKAARNNMLGSGVSNAKVKYSRLAADEDGYIDLQVRDQFFQFVKTTHLTCVTRLCGGCNYCYCYISLVITEWLPGHKRWIWNKSVLMTSWLGAKASCARASCGWSRGHMTNSSVKDLFLFDTSSFTLIFIIKVMHLVCEHHLYHSWTHVSAAINHKHVFQFKKSPPKVPYKAIALAIFLFLIGSLLIIFGALLLSGTIKVEVSLATTSLSQSCRSSKVQCSNHVGESMVGFR